MGSVPSFFFSFGVGPHRNGTEPGAEQSQREAPTPGAQPPEAPAPSQTSDSHQQAETSQQSTTETFRVWPRHPFLRGSWNVMPAGHSEIGIAPDPATGDEMKTHWKKHACSVSEGESVFCWRLFWQSFGLTFHVPCTCRIAPRAPRMHISRKVLREPRAFAVDRTRRRQK